jgi:predicted Zn-dependent peptidase
LHEAFDTFYRPDNMILTVCGRVDPEEICALVQEVMEKFLVKVRRALPAASPRIKVMPDVFSSRATVRCPVSKPLFCIGIKCPDLPVGREALWRRDLTVSVLCETLFSHAGDFYSDLFERGLVSPGMSYGYLVGDSPRLPAKMAYGYFDLSGESDCPETVFEEFRIFAERIREKGIPEEDFNRAKRVLYAEFTASFDTTEDIASLLGSYAQDGLCAYDFFRTLESITRNDTWELFDKTFRDSQYTLSVVLPTEAAD